VWVEGNHQQQTKGAAEGTGSEIVEQRCAQAEVVAATTESEMDGGGFSMWTYLKRWMVEGIGSPRAARQLAVIDPVLARLDTRSTASAWTSTMDSGPLQFSPMWWCDRRRTVADFDGELHGDREVVGVVAPPCAMAHDFPLGRHHGMRRWTSFEIGGIINDWLVGDR
jgi:hypothetical protein